MWLEIYYFLYGSQGFLSKSLWSFLLITSLSVLLIQGSGHCCSPATPYLMWHDESVSPILMKPSSVLWYFGVFSLPSVRASLSAWTFWNTHTQTQTVLVQSISTFTYFSLSPYYNSETQLSFGRIWYIDHQHRSTVSPCVASAYLQYWCRSQCLSLTTYISWLH